MPLKGNVSGTWKDYTAWVNVAGTWKTAAVWKNVAGVWKRITGAMLPASIAGYHDTFFPADATATVSLNAAGTWNAAGGSSGTWLNGGTSADYEARWTTTSGTLHSGTAGSWLNLGTTRSWGTIVTGAGVSTLVGTLEIRLAASPYTVLTSSTVTLTATVEVA